MKKFLIALLLILCFVPALAQQSSDPLPYFTYGKGLGMTSPDSLFHLNIRFRIQNRAAFKTESESDLSIDEVEARIRRLRLRFDGFIYTTRLTYVIQLAFSRGDLDYDDTGFPNIIRDAMVLYAVNKNFTIGIGQTKLPGNRQRVNSSGDLQLPDRSLVNSTFNIDRDFGLQLYYNNNFSGDFSYVLRGAVSSGEGRNFNSSDNGLAYTGRMEFLPLGLFTNNGDYFEGDLVREQKPKLSLGLTYSENFNAIRTGGQLGKFLFEPRDIETAMADFLLKYNGWAFAAEYIKRNSADPITSELDEVRYVYAGHGQNFQGSYLFKNNFEIAGRFTEVRPDRDIQLLEELTRQYTLGVTKYLRGHRVKLQTDLTYETNQWLAGTEADHNNWQLRFQIEAGI